MQITIIRTRLAFTIARTSATVLPLFNVAWLTNAVFTRGDRRGDRRRDCRRDRL